MSMQLYVALVHYPVYDKNHKVVTTAVTNVDVHDISRSSATFGVAGFFVVTPVTQQKQLVSELLAHWLDGPGSTYNPRRSEAISFARVVSDISGAVEAIEADTGVRPITIGTGASLSEGIMEFDVARDLLANGRGPALLVLGTGWGLEKGFVAGMDYLLAPIRGAGEYNHLSVRSAAAILLDRLLGRELNDT